MFKRIQSYFIPSAKNNYKAKILHPSSLTFIVTMVLFFQASLNLIANVRPDVLGYSSSINPERIIELTNRERADKNLSSLKIDPLLSEAAQAKGADMMALDYWAHNSPRGLTPWVFISDAGYNYLYAGENLARDFAAPEAVVAAWMDSPTHSDNILNPHYEDIGVAVIDGVFQDHESTLVVQMFGKKFISAPQVKASEPVGETAPSKEFPQPTRIHAPLPQEEKIIVPQEPAISSPAAILAQSPFNPFKFNRIFSLGLAAILFLVLLVDGLIVLRSRKIRAAGHNFIHGTFLLLVIIMLLLTRQGLIL